MFIGVAKENNFQLWSNNAKLSQPCKLTLMSTQSQINKKKIQVSL